MSLYLNDPAVLITGATGFLGQEIVRQLVDRSARLRTTGRRTTPPTGLPNYSAADVADRAAARRLVAGVDVAIHAAGLAHQHRAGESQRDAFFRVNVAGTETLARAAAEAGCRRFVLVSSVAVYGGGWPAKTERDLCRPIGPYAESKRQAERVAEEIAASAGMELVVLRLATLYGEGDPGNVGRLLRAIDRGRFVWIGRGENRKSLVHIEDAARACAMAGLHPEPAPETTYNVAGEPATMREIVATLAAALGRRTPALHLPPRVPRWAAAIGGIVPGIADRMQRLGGTLEKWLSDEVYDASLVRRSLGWSPQVTLSDGLTRQAMHYRQCQQTRFPTAA